MSCHPFNPKLLPFKTTKSDYDGTLGGKKKPSSDIVVMFKKGFILGLAQKKTHKKERNDSRSVYVLLAAALLMTICSFADDESF